MARSGVLYVHVTQVAAQLAAAGHNSTIDRIRAALGGTGSKSTLAPLLKRWKAAHPGPVVQAELGLPAELVLALKEVYEKVRAEASVQYQQAAQAHHAETAALQEQLDLTVAERDGLLDSQAQQVQALAMADTRIEALAEVVQRQEIVLASLGSEKLGLEQRLGDRAAEITSLTQQLQQGLAQFEHYQASVAQQRADERRSVEQRDHRQEHELAELPQRLLAQQTRVGDLQAQEQRLLQDHERLQSSLQTTQEALTKSRTTHQLVGDQLAELKQGYEVPEQRFKHGGQCLAKTQISLAVSERERSQLAERLTRTETQLNVLTTDKQVLLQDNAVLASQLAESRP